MVIIQARHTETGAGQSPRSSPSGGPGRASARIGDDGRLSNSGQLTSHQSSAKKIGSSHSNRGTAATSGYTMTFDEGEVPLLVPRRYRISRKVIVEAVRVLDVQDAPDEGGLVRASTLRKVLLNFLTTFRSSADPPPEQAVQNVIEKLPRFGALENTEDPWSMDSSVGSMVSNRRTSNVEMTIRSMQLPKEDYFVEWEHDALFDAFCATLNFKERIFFTIDVSESSTAASRFSSIFLMFTIFASVLAMCLASVRELQEVPCKSATPGECQPEPIQALTSLEAACVYVFTFEYGIRLLLVHAVRFELINEYWIRALICGDDDQPATGPRQLDQGYRRTFAFLMDPTNLVDLVAIIPHWVEYAIQDQGASSLVVLRILRLTRIFRVFKLGRYNDDFVLFQKVILKSAPALHMGLFLVIMAMGVFGTMVWITDRGVWYSKGHAELLKLNITDRGAFLRDEFGDAKEETPFQSITDTFWWVIVTISTVGYGDMYPKTDIGRVCGSLAIMCGVLTLAMPVGVIGTNFSNEYDDVQLDKARRNRQRIIEKERQRLRQLKLERLGEPKDKLPQKLIEDLAAAHESILQLNSQLDVVASEERGLNHFHRGLSKNLQKVRGSISKYEKMRIADPVAPLCESIMDHVLEDAFCHLRAWAASTDSAKSCLSAQEANSLRLAYLNAAEKFLKLGVPPVPENEVQGKTSKSSNSRSDLPRVSSRSTSSIQQQTVTVGDGHPSNVPRSEKSGISEGSK